MNGAIIKSEHDALSNEHKEQEDASDALLKKELEQLVLLAKGSYLFVETAIGLKKTGLLQNFENLPEDITSASYFATVFQKNFVSNNDFSNEISPALGLLCVCNSAIKLRHLVAIYFHQSPCAVVNDNTSGATKVLLLKMRKLLHSAGSMVEETEINNGEEQLVKVNKGVKEWLLSDGAGRFKVDEKLAHNNIFLFLLRKATGKAEFFAQQLFKNSDKKTLEATMSEQSDTRSDAIFDEWEEQSSLGLFNQRWESENENVQTSGSQCLLTPVEVFHLLFHLTKAYKCDDSDNSLRGGNRKSVCSQILKQVDTEQLLTGRALYIAVKKNELNVARLLLNHVFETLENFEHLKTILKYRGGSSSILKLAIRKRNLDMVKLLIETADAIRVDLVLDGGQQQHHAFVFDNNSLVDQNFLPLRTAVYLAASRKKFVDFDILKIVIRASKNVITSVGDVFQRLVPTLGACCFELIANGFVDEFEKAISIVTSEESEESTAEVVQEGENSENGNVAEEHFEKRDKTNIARSPRGQNNNNVNSYYANFNQRVTPLILNWSRNASYPPFKGKSLLEVAPTSGLLKRLLHMKNCKTSFLFRSGEVIKLLEQKLSDVRVEDSPKDVGNRSPKRRASGIFGSDGATVVINVLLEHVWRYRTDTLEKRDFVVSKFREYTQFYPEQSAKIEELMAEEYQESES